MAGALDVPYGDEIERVRESLRESPGVDELQIDLGLREGADEASVGERARPPSDEVLIGDVDMLAGPAAAIEQDMDQAMGEGAPWIPPDEPTFAEPPRRRPMVDRDGIRTIARAEPTGERPAARENPD